MQYNIQNFNPVQPNRSGLFDSFIDARNRRDLNMMVQEKARAEQMVEEEKMAVARAKAEAEAAEREMIANAFDMAHKDPTPENKMRIVGILAQRNPEQAKAMQSAFSAYDTETQQTILRDSARIYTALETDPEQFGIPMLEELATAAENAGEAGDAKKYREKIAQAKSGSGGLQAVKDYFTFIIGTIPGGDKAFEGMAKVGKENRERANAPAEQRKLLAEAGLSEAKINETMANTRKLDAETQKLILEAVAKQKSGGLSEKELKDTTIQLNNTVNTRTAGARTAQTSYDNIREGAATNDGVGDLAIVNTFMRMLSPGIVTEQDYNAATASGGFLDQIKTLKSKVEAGSLLTPEQRTKFTSLAKKYADNAVAQSEKQLTSIRKIVADLGIEPDRVFNMDADDPELVARDELSKLRAFVKANNPPEKTGSVDTMTDEQIKVAFPAGYSAFKATPAVQPVVRVNLNN